MNGCWTFPTAFFWMDWMIKHSLPHPFFKLSCLFIHCFCWLQFSRHMFAGSRAPTGPLPLCYCITARGYQILERLFLCYSPLHGVPRSIKMYIVKVECYWRTVWSTDISHNMNKPEDIMLSERSLVTCNFINII